MPGARAHLAMQPFIVRMMRVGFNSKADVAQLVEQLIRNQQVSGSTPLVGSIVFEDFSGRLTAACQDRHSFSNPDSAAPPAPLVAQFLFLSRSVVELLVELKYGSESSV
jgi:hypothetical protein